MDDNTLSSFRDQLRSQIAEKCTEVSGSPGDEEAAPAFKEEAFTQVVLELLEDLGQIGAAEICYFEKKVGRSKVRINAWSYEEEEGRLDVVTAIFRGAESSDTVSRADVGRAVKQAANLYSVARSGFHEEVEPASDVYSMLQRVHEVGDRVERMRVIVLADGVAADPGQLEVSVNGVELHRDLWDHRRLMRALASGVPYEPVTIDLRARLGRPLPCLQVPLDGEYQAFLAFLPGGLLQQLYHEFGSRLLELNVRSFLMLRGKVNKGIRKTLLEEPHRFMAYNNGLSVTAESLDLLDDDSGNLAIGSITGFQVVNGGQTVATIHRVGQAEKADLSEVFVQAKITVIREDQIETLVPLVSRYSNTQNRVNEADFSANTAFHVRLQKLSETVWCPGETTRWFYERARGQYQVARAREGTTPKRKKAFDTRTPTKQKFDKVLVAKYVNAWGMKPHVVSRGGQKNFAAFTQDLVRRHGPDWEPGVDYYKMLIGKAIIYKAAERCARRHAFPGYRVNAVAYTVALVSWRTAGRVDLMQIWERQAVSEVLGSVIHDWMPVVREALIDTAGDRNVGEWCKKEECWRELQTLDLNLPDELRNELAEGQPLPTVGDIAGQIGRLTEEEREDIARVMQVDAEGWLELVKWGGRTGELKAWQLGIATTLASYAATGWSKVPSAKQAKHGARILVQAIEAGEDWSAEE